MGDVMLLGWIARVRAVTAGTKDGRASVCSSFGKIGFHGERMEGHVDGAAGAAPM
jgi:hypothetical protein